MDTSDDMQPATIRDLISETVMTVKQTVEKVKANGNQCKRLGERIDAIVSLLKPMNDADLQQSGLKKPLVDLAICTEQCLAFLRKFQDETVWFSEVFNNQTFKDQFKKLNDQLFQCAKDLRLNINLPSIFNEKHDREDEEKDLKDIQSKEDQISRLMIDKEQDQFRHLQGITEHQSRRYNSYKYHLKQNITQAHHSIKTRKSTNDQYPFLQIPYYDLVQKECIGHGGFADVYRGRWVSQDHDVAIKVIRIQYIAERVKSDFFKEISTMHRIRYEHVLSMFGACIEPDNYALVVEYMSLGSLYDVLSDKKIEFTWPNRWSIALQMTKGVNYLHTLPDRIIHRDIKSPNILMSEGVKGFLVKIGDFGLAKIRHETSRQSRDGSAVGTIPWKAPELLKITGKHTTESDVYALGIVFWELATGSEPYEGADDPTISTLVRLGDRMEIPVDVPQSFGKVIIDAWAQEPAQRPTCQQLIYLLKNQSADSSTLEAIQVRNLVVVLL